MQTLAAARRALGVVLGVATVLSACTFPRQVPDRDFRFPVETPTHPAGTGPRIAVDAGHGNFHTVDERFAPFATLLEDDGYRVEAFAGRITAEALASIDVLVIANPLAEANASRWKLPTHPAYTADESAELGRWIDDGGALLLIADHMPFPGAAESLAADLGVFFANGYAQDAEADGHLVYGREDGTLRAHPISDGGGASRRVESVKVFTGQAFRVRSDVAAEPLLVLPPGSKVLLPAKPREFTDRTPYILAEELLQGAVFRRGAGRVAVFGEAAMFTAQLAVSRKETRRIGMSADGAEDNPRFVLNVLEWLTAVAQ